MRAYMYILPAPGTGRHVSSSLVDELLVHRLLNTEDVVDELLVDKNLCPQTP